jgi:hypothetical protein
MWQDTLQYQRPVNSVKISYFLKWILNLRLKMNWETGLCKIIYLVILYG